MGLIYDTVVDDYLMFLYNFGFKKSQITFVSGNQGFNCSSDANEEMISNMNYLKIFISSLKSTKSIPSTNSQ